MTQSPESGKQMTPIEAYSLTSLVNPDGSPSTKGEEILSLYNEEYGEDAPGLNPEQPNSEVIQFFVDKTGEQITGVVQVQRIPTETGMHSYLIGNEAGSNIPKLIESAANYCHETMKPGDLIVFNSSDQSQANEVQGIFIEAGFVEGPNSKAKIETEEVLISYTTPEDGTTDKLGVTLQRKSPIDGTTKRNEVSIVEVDTEGINQLRTSFAFNTSGDFVSKKLVGDDSSRFVEELEEIAPEATWEPVATEYEIIAEKK